jgi:hypothetical protein
MSATPYNYMFMVLIRLAVNARGPERGACNSEDAMCVIVLHHMHEILSTRHAIEALANICVLSGKYI